MPQLLCALVMAISALTQLPFVDAAAGWLETRKPYISDKTYHEYSLNIKTLAAFFGELRLTEIDGDLVRAYQKMRRQSVTKSGKLVGPPSINHETGLLVQIRKRIGVPLTDYQPLPLSKDKPGRVLSDIERERLLRIAGSNPNWQAAYLFAVLSVNTSAGPKEIASLRLKDVDWERERINIPGQGAKNKFRARPIPLNTDALEAMKSAVERAKKLGSIEPNHQIFPFRINRAKFDPNRFQTTFKTAWRKITEAAHLGGLQMYDLRRTAVTNLLENPEVSDETIEEIVGHVPGSCTKKKYSYIRVEARRKAVACLAQKKPPQTTKANVVPPSKETVQALAEILSKLLQAR